MEYIKSEQTNELKGSAPEGATHYNFNGTLFPYEKHSKKDIYVWANGNWELTNVPSCAIPLQNHTKVQIDFDNCPACGDVPEIITDSDEHGVFFDGDPVQCVKCGCSGYFSVDYDTENGYINWNE